jgi:hypothetical protein
VFQLASLLGGSSGGGGTTDTGGAYGGPISNYIGGIGSSPFPDNTPKLITYGAFALAALAVFLLLRK